MRKHIPVAGLLGREGMGSDLFTIVLGRATGCRVWHVIPGALIVVSVYLRDGVGLNDDNWQVLLRVGEVLAYHGLPYVIGGDFNMDAEVLEHSGWLKRIKGRAMASKLGTCRGTKGSYSNIDYFVVADVMSASAGPAEAVTCEPAKPHRPVQLALKGAPRAEKERHLKAPKKFPAEWPIGCSPPPPPWSIAAVGIDDLKGKDRLEAHYRFPRCWNGAGDDRSLRHRGRGGGQVPWEGGWADLLLAARTAAGHQRAAAVVP